MENDTTPYNYSQSARWLIVQVAVKPSGWKLLDKIRKNVAKFFTVPEVPTG